jgi:hypothetical protein
MVHLPRCSKVRRIGGAHAENTTAPTAPAAPPADNQQNSAADLDHAAAPPSVSSAVIQDVAASASMHILPCTTVWVSPCRRRHHIDNPKGGGSTSRAFRGAASGTVRPIRWMRRNRGAW